MFYFVLSKPPSPQWYKHIGQSQTPSQLTGEGEAVVLGVVFVFANTLLLLLTYIQSTSASAWILTAGGAAETPSLSIGRTIVMFRFMLTR